eukprot:gnl/TRDRNA2_/TRDRNA2_151503_c0_seq1.p1 gnl/TRDRNA2_/TRDRNA2_151503_c0~~gnl/TRDRNA2_/TRDRNA2_151503_c0_seq1.p1  ORF type:complete len:395 (-),score=132.31 gnl/TRDRNA2_/TRDRNA2_151503_c0_seq1:116-1300(-)
MANATAFLAFALLVLSGNCEVPEIDNILLQVKSTPSEKAVASEAASSGTLLQQTDDSERELAEAASKASKARAEYEKMAEAEQKAAQDKAKAAKFAEKLQEKADAAAAKAKSAAEIAAAAERKRSEAAKAAESAAVEEKAAAEKVAKLAKVQPADSADSVHLAAHAAAVNDLMETNASPEEQVETAPTASEEQVDSKSVKLDATKKESEAERGILAVPEVSKLRLKHTVSAVQQQKTESLTEDLQAWKKAMEGTLEKSFDETEKAHQHEEASTASAQHKALLLSADEVREKQVNDLKQTAKREGYTFFGKRAAARANAEEQPATAQQHRHSDEVSQDGFTFLGQQTADISADDAVRRYQHDGPTFFGQRTDDAFEPDTRPASSSRNVWIDEESS